MKLSRTSKDKGFVLMEGIILIFAVFLFAALACGVVFSLAGGFFSIGFNIGLLAVIPTLMAGNFGGGIAGLFIDKKHNKEFTKICQKSIEEMSDQQIQTLKEVLNKILVLVPKSQNDDAIKTLQALADKINSENIVELEGYKLFCEMVRNSNFRWYCNDVSLAITHATNIGELTEKVKGFIPELPKQTKLETAAKTVAFLAPAALMFTAIAYPLNIFFKHIKEPKKQEDSKPALIEKANPPAPSTIIYKTNWQEMLAEKKQITETRARAI